MYERMKLDDAKLNIESDEGEREERQEKGRSCGGTYPIEESR